MTRKIIALVLAALMLLGTVAFAEPENVPAYGDVVLTIDNMKAEGDAANEYSICATSTVPGYYTDKVTANDVTYSYRRYIPENCQLNCPAVTMIIPSNTDPYDFLVSSGWKNVADTERLMVAILVPQNEAGTWGTWAEESAYLNSITANVLCGNFRYCRRDAMYMVGYGDGADLAVKYVMADKVNFYSSAAYIGTTGIDADYVAEMNATPSKEDGISMAQIPVNTFIVAEASEDVERLVAYYQAANKTLTEATALELNGITFDRYYAPDETADVGQPNADPCCGVSVATGSADIAMGDDAAMSIWKKMATVRKWTGFGNHLARTYENPYDGIHYTEYYASTTLGHLVYGGDIIDEAGNKTEGNYYERQWFVYVPDSVNEILAANPEAKIPVVFNTSGNSAFGTHTAPSQGWDKCAQDNGFILVIPSQTLHFSNGAFALGWFADTNELHGDSILFMDELYAWLLNDSEYASYIDRNRIYATGHSMGGMFTLYLSNYRPQYFAACAPCSEMIQPVDNAYHAIETAYDLPVMIGCGQKDKYMNKLVFGTTADNPTLMGGNGKDKIAYFVDRYNLNGKAWEEYTFGSDDAVCTVKTGRINEYQWTTEKGYIMFEALEVVGMEHNVIPEECQLIWDRMFSHYTRDYETKVVYYDGEVLDTANNMALYEATK